MNKIIEMCLNADEIQALKKVGDFCYGKRFVTLDGDLCARCEAIYGDTLIYFDGEVSKELSRKEDAIYIPTSSELTTMLTPVLGGHLKVLELFLEWAKKALGHKDMLGLELWIRFYMQKKHHKVYIKNKWVEEYDIGKF